MRLFDIDTVLLVGPAKDAVSRAFDYISAKSTHIERILFCHHLERECLTHGLLEVCVEMVIISSVLTNAHCISPKVARIFLQVNGSTNLVSHEIIG
jgi:hypothetical protein